ncbi:MAG: GNAT family N-acetyltransferase [Pseudomonadota bacterium]
MTVRAGTAQDFLSCIPMAERFWSVAGYAGDIPFDADSTVDYFAMGLKAGLFAVAEKSGEVIGFVIGVTTPSMVNRDCLIGAELAWWMEPEHRNSMDAIRLLKHIELMAKEAGCKLWSMMCLEALEPEKVEKMYLKMGYEKSERTFTRRLH